MRTACEAVLVRYSPDVLAGESLNIGVLLVSRARGYADTRFLAGWQRVTGAFPGTDYVQLRRICSALARGCAEWREQGEFIGRDAETAAGLFDSIVHRDDASISRSQPISGLTADPVRTLEELFERYVGRLSQSGPGSKASLIVPRP